MPDQIEPCPTCGTRDIDFVLFGEAGGTMSRQECRNGHTFDGRWTPNVYFVPRGTVKRTTVAELLGSRP